MQSEEVVEKRRRGAEKETSLMKAQCTRIANEERKKNGNLRKEKEDHIAPTKKSKLLKPENQNCSYQKIKITPKNSKFLQKNEN